MTEFFRSAAEVTAMAGIVSVFLVVIVASYLVVSIMLLLPIEVLLTATSSARHNLTTVVNAVWRARSR